MKYLFSTIIIGILFISSCKKETSEIKAIDTSIQTANATIDWMGHYSTDGCGYFITVHSNEVKAINEDFIDSTFIGSSKVPVEITFQYLLDPIKYDCGDNPHSSKINGVLIHAIKKR